MSGNILPIILAFIIGSCIGSFLNVCISRLPKNVSIIKPASFCPQCKTPIKWHDNIPVLSYILLRGKCRNCRQGISLRYPLVEFIAGVLFVIVYMKLGITFAFLKFIFFFSLLVVISFIDIDYRAVPVYLCFIGIIVGLAFSMGESIAIFKKGSLGGTALPIVASFKGLIVGFGFTYLFKFFGDIVVSMYLHLRKKESIDGEKEALGLGDVDFLGMAGVFLGASQAILIFFIAPFIALFYSVFALIFKKSHVIPYLPYLSLATLVVFLWGNRILGFIF